HDGADEASVGAEPQSGPAPPPRAGATPTSAGGPSGGGGSDVPVGAARGCSRGDGGAAPPAGADVACAPPPPGGGASPCWCGTPSTRESTPSASMSACRTTSAWEPLRKALASPVVAMPSTRRCPS